MEKYILFAGRKIPIATKYDVLTYDNERAPSFYAPEKTLSPDKLMQMSLLRPTMRNYSFRNYKGKWFDRDLLQLFGADRSELDMLGEALYQVALHHDVTTSATDTYSVLCTRGLSTHFVVNYDGVLYQMMDPYHTAWATGENNNMCVAIDMNNPVYPELRDIDPAAGKREIYQGKINGSVKTMLGYTEEQYETLIALFKALITPIQVPGEEPWIPMSAFAANCFPPISESGEVINRLLRDSTQFKGFLGHYHCSSNKWDPGPAFDWMRVLSGIKGKRNSLPILIGEGTERKNLSELGGKYLSEHMNRFYLNAETAEGGWYPIGVNQSWHSGIHLAAPKDTPVLNMMDGTIVAIRNVATVDLGDPSFVLVRHERQETGIDGQDTSVFWYSLYMHLAPLIDTGKFDEISWVRELLGAEAEVPDDVLYNLDSGKLTYAKGLPKTVDGTVKSKDPGNILRAFFRGDILIVNIPYEAGKVLGHVGLFGRSPAHLERQVHIEVISPDNIFQRGNAQSEAWSIIEGDISDYSLVRVKRITKPISDLVSLYSGKTTAFLRSSEIQAFFALGNTEPLASRRDAFRKMICYHRSEWSPLMNWTKTAIQSVGWQWESEESFGKWLVLWLPFQWLTRELTSALDLPAKHFFFTYHPIYLLEQLNLSYSGDISQTAEVASDSEFKDNANLLAGRVAELTELNRKLENKETLSPAERERHEELYQLMDDHLDDKRADIAAETRYEYFSNAKFDEWEAGEWPLPQP